MGTNVKAPQVDTTVQVIQVEAPQVDTSVQVPQVEVPQVYSKVKVYELDPRGRAYECLLQCVCMWLFC